MAAAKSQEGVPYRWGGESPGGGFDCSGLTQWAWGRAGVSLPRTAAAQYGAIAHVSLSSLEPGDLLFWGAGGGISHVGMYVGGGDVIDAPETGRWCASSPSGTAGWSVPAVPDARRRGDTAAFPPIAPLAGAPMGRSRR